MTTLMNWIMMYKLTGLLYVVVMATIIVLELSHKYGAENVLAAIKKSYRGSGRLGVDIGMALINATINTLIWPIAYSYNLVRVWNTVTVFCENNRD